VGKQPKRIAKARQSIIGRVPELPRVTRRLLDAVVYIYRGENEALRGDPTGATGCLISYPIRREGFTDLAHLYLLTNSHVAKRDGRSSVVRFNRVSDGVELVKISGDAWVHHPDADIAIAPLDVDQTKIRVADISIGMFLSQDHVSDGTFIEGDECIFIGRHYGLDGTMRNTPAVRMGSVAIFNPEPVWFSEFFRAETSVAIEARSLSGFSGSPVFVWQGGGIAAPLYQDLLREGRNSLIGKWPVVLLSRMESRLAFLGITWGHMNGPNVVLEHGSLDDPAERALVLNSGIMLAVPAWKILELLDQSELATMRDQAEAALTSGPGQNTT